MGLFQIFVGVAIGLVALFFVTKAVTYNEPHQEGRRRSGSPARPAKTPRKYKAKIGDNCVICLEAMKAVDIYFLSCEHALHVHCYNINKKSNGKKCPVCREADTSSS